MNARNVRADAAPPSTMGRRFVAILLDVLVWVAVGGWLVVAGVIGWARAEPSTPASQDALGLMTVGLALSAALVLVQWLLHARFGWTIGRLAMGIRTLDVETRLPIGAARIFVRSVVVAAGFLVALVGGVVVLVSPLFDRTRRNRGWHDRAAGDEVLDVRASARAAADQPPRRDVPVASERAPATRGPVPVPRWAARPAATTGGAPTSLVLAPVAPRRSSPDLDTRTIPVVLPGAGDDLAPELERTRPVAQKLDPVEPESEQDSSAAEFELSDGQRVRIERIALVGRNPESDADVQLVRVADPTLSVSKTHLQIGVERAGVWVADRGSTNGTMVTLPDGGQVVCGPDRQVRIRLGSTIVFGDCSMRLVRVPVAPSTPAGTGSAA